MKDEIKEKDIIQKSIECLSNAKFNDTTYEVARDIILDYIINLQQELKEANDSITWWSNRFKTVKHENELLKEKGKNDEKI